MKTINVLAVGSIVCMFALAIGAQETKTAAPQQQAVSNAPASPAVQTQPSSAQPQVAQPQTAPSAKPAVSKKQAVKKSRLHGTVQTVDATTKKLTIKTKKDEVKEFIIGDDVKITKGGNRKSITLADIKEGSRVEIRMEDEAIKSVHIQVASRIK